MCKRRGFGVVEWAEARGLSLRVNWDETVGFGGWMRWM